MGKGCVRVFESLIMLINEAALHTLKIIFLLSFVTTWGTDGLNFSPGVDLEGRIFVVRTGD